MGLFRWLLGPAVESAIDRERREYAEAAERWRRINAEAKAAGCLCGRPATVVRKYGGTIGGVPHEVWTCHEHRHVGQWQRTGDGPWRPTGDSTPEVEALREDRP